MDDTAVAAAGADLTRRLQAQPDVVDVGSYWSLGRPAALRSRDGDRALVVARTNGGEDRRGEIGQTVIDDFQSGDDTAVSVEVGGLAAAYAQFNSTIKNDLARAESLRHPDHAGPARAGLRLAGGSKPSAARGGLSIVGALLSLYVITLVTDVSIFAINLVTAMGLGLGIDYALFIVSRFREELARGCRRRTTPSSARCAPPDAPSCSPASRSPLALVRDAGLPAVLPALLRLRGHRRRRRRRCVAAIVVLPATLVVARAPRRLGCLILRRSATAVRRGRSGPGSPGW